MKTKAQAPEGTAGGLEALLRAAARGPVLLDSSAIILAVEGEGPRAETARRLLALVEEAAAPRADGSAPEAFLASAAALAELLAKPLREGDAALAARHRAFLASWPRLRLVPVDAAVAEAAAAVSAGRPALGLGDALHLATARIAGAAAVLGDDAAWEGIPGGPPFFAIGELAAELEFD